MDCESNSTRTCCKFEVMDTVTSNIQGVVTHWTNGSSPKVYPAIENIKSFLENETPIDMPLQTTGSLAGYTELHMACVKKNKGLVKMLVEEYHADINVVANDGAQPIHLACLFGDDEALDILLKAGANADAELERDLFSKYAKDKEWCNEFGDKMTILTFATLYEGYDLLAISLIDNKANLKVKSLENKTLLMYAIEKQVLFLGTILANVTQDLEFINARDNYGFSAAHYVLHPEKLESYQYPGEYEEQLNDLQNGITMNRLIEAGTDIYATVSNDPDTLLLNMAASRYSVSVIHQLLPHCEHITKSRALYYVTLPLEHPQMGSLQELRKESTVLILKDLVNRSTFGLPVPEEEKKLMNELIAKYASVKELVNSYERYFLQGELKNIVIQYDDKTITFYDFILSCFNNKKIRRLVKNKALIDAFKNSSLKYGDHFFFYKQLLMRIERATKRVEILDRLSKIENLRQAVPLPYELVLIMLEYLNNQDCDTFINAFYV